MVQQLKLDDWAWQIATDVYRLNLFSRLTGRAAPKGGAVSDEQLSNAIRESFTQTSDAAYREMVELATDAALSAYERIVSRNVRQARAQLAN